MKKYSIILITTLIVTTNILADSKNTGPDFRRTIGTLQDCRNLETDINALKNKPNISAKAAQRFHAQEYNFEKAQCNEKLKAKNKAK